jgi:hypothetical protein
MYNLRTLIFGMAFFGLNGLISCNSVPDGIAEDAQSLCNCYKQVHKIEPEEEPLINFITDSCNTMWKGIYDKYADQEEQKKLFNQAYSACQDE